MRQMERGTEMQGAADEGDFMAFWAVGWAGKEL